MKKQLFTSLLLAATVGAASNTYGNDDHYLLVALKDCQVLDQKIMTDEQRSAYQALEYESARMDDIENPVQGIESQIEQFSEEIERLTLLAIQETDSTLYIDKDMLKEQEAVAQELEAFMQLHEASFDALAQQAQSIEAAAKRFESSIEDDFAHLDYDRLEIITPDQDPTASCYRSASILR